MELILCKFGIESRRVAIDVRWLHTDYVYNSAMYFTTTKKVLEDQAQTGLL